MANFGLFRGFSEKLFQGELPINLGEIGSEDITPITYILDLYPSAAAAYSLRKLRSAYTGSAIRVRRSSDNTEQDIGFTALVELDTTSLTTFCGSGNGFVTTWYDQSGNANNATQSTAANQPQIVSSGSVLLQNAKPTISFDGSNDSLPFNGSFISNSNYSIYANIARKSNKSNNHILGGTNTNTNSLLHIGYRNNTTFTLAHFDPDLDATISGYTSTILELYSLYNNNVGKYIFQNNALKASNTNTIDLSSWTGSNIGNYANISYAFINVNEIIMYSSDQYNNNTGINTNINTYYGIY